MNNNSLIQILGTTSSGKSDLAVDLAIYLQKQGFRTLIISCDSRQIYKELDLGTGKILGQHIIEEDLGIDTFRYRSIDHLLIDYVSLEDDYSLYQYLNDYLELIQKTKDKIDYYIVTGGTGLYAKAIYEEYQVGIYQDDCNNYSNHSLEDLQKELNQADFNNSDWQNPRRLIARIKSQSQKTLSKKLNYPNFKNKYKFIIKHNQELTTKRILDRITSRIEQGMLTEIEKIFVKYGYTKLVALGLEYKYGAYFCYGFITQQEFINLLNQATTKYLKRQLTWLRKEKDSTYINNLRDLTKMLI